MPVQIVFALCEALDHAFSETAAGRAHRYALMADLLRIGLARRGFDLVELPKGQRSNVVIPVRLPPDLDYRCLQADLESLKIEIYSAEEALAAGYFFVAAMGALSYQDIDQFADALLAGCLRHGAELGRREPAEEAHAEV